MTPSGKTISVVVLSYLLFGLFNLFQFGAFVVPVTYTELVIFIMVLASYVQNREQLRKYHLLLFIYALTGFILHPFLWEIFLNQEQQYTLYNFISFDILRIIQWILLALFFFSLSYNREENTLKIEWLIPAVLAIGCLFNPPMWYPALMFILSGLSALYTLRRRQVTEGEFTMEILIGIGVIYLINIFYLIE